MSCSKFRVDLPESPSSDAGHGRSRTRTPSRVSQPSNATKRWRTWWESLSPEDRDERINRKRDQETKRRINAQMKVEAPQSFSMLDLNIKPDISSEPTFVIVSPSSYHTPTSTHQSTRRHIRLDEAIFGLAKGTRLPMPIFERLVHLWAQLNVWDDQQDPFDLASELALLERLDSAFKSGADGYDVLLQVRNTHVELHRSGQDLESEFKDILTASTSRGAMRPLLDALTQHGRGLHFCLFRIRQLDALLVRWRSQDYRVVREALQERVDRARRLAGNLPTGAGMNSLNTLSPDRWLGDEVINSMLILCPPVADVLLLDSMFYVYLSRGEWERLPKHNLLMRNGPKLWDQLWHKIIFPVHERGCHWVLVCLDFQARSATVYDSLAFSDQSDSRTEIMQNLEKLVSSIVCGSPDELPSAGWIFNANFFKEAIQHDGHECGVFTIIFVYHLNGGEIDGDHVPSHLRLSQTKGTLHGLRMFILDMLLAA